MLKQEKANTARFMSFEKQNEEKRKKKKTKQKRKFIESKKERACSETIECK
jgi:hypothetical protein